MSETTFTWAVRTDVGRVREVNQDAVYAEEGLFVVADGMGGHRGGEVASAIAVEAMGDGEAPPSTVDALIERVRSAHQAVLERADADPELLGMGTTVCAIARLDEADQPGMLGVVNVGDSRIYRFADGELTQLTEDHSLVGDLVRAGHLTPDEAANHPQRNIVTRALGIGEQLLVDYWEVPAVPEDHYLLCSDGLVDEVGDNQIAAVLRRLVEPTEIVDELVRLALEAGARDNVSVLVLRVDQTADPDGPDSVEGFMATSTSAPGPVSVEPPTLETEVVGVGVNPGVATDDDAHIDMAGARERLVDARVPLSELDGDDDPAPAPADGDRSAVRRRRGLGLLVLMALIVIGSIWIIASYARNNYFVGFENEQVVVYQGRPGGVLWFDPTIEEGGVLTRDDLPDALEL
jgi:protein phosphatase